MEYKTYIDECLQKNLLTRWSDKLMPLKIYIAPFRWYQKKESVSAQYKYNGMIIEALNMWANATDNAFSYQIIDQKMNSNIDIDWKRVDRTSLGMCYFNFDQQGRLYSAEVQIGLSDGVIHQEYMSENEVRHTVIHEIGHALGLQHSPYPNDIMYVPHQYGISNASVRDKMTLKWLYKLPEGKTPAEIINMYSGGDAKSIDEMIYKFLTNKEPSKFQKTADELSKNQKKRDLLQENENLGNIKLYQMSINQIEMSSDIQNYIKKSKLNKRK